MKTKVLAALSTLSLLGAATASAAPPTPAGPTHGGLEIDIRAGYSVPLGTAFTSAASGGSVDNKLKDATKGQIPIRLDVGWRINSHFYVGVYGGYGFGAVNLDSEQGKSCAQLGVECSISFIDFGVMGAYHVRPDQAFDPWVGLGVGYEMVKTRQTTSSVDTKGGFSGPTFVDVQLGGDYKASPNVSIGPFVGFAVGQYSKCTGDAAASGCAIDTKTLHEWFTLGVKGTFGIW